MVKEKLSRREIIGGAVGLGLAGMSSRASFASDAIGLDITTRTLDVRGKPAKVFGLIGPDGRPGLSLGPGQRFRVDLSNHSGVPTLIHWHGLTPPSDQDGVPDLSQPILAPGAGYSYDFPLRGPGTFWMHSHVGLQEQQLMAAPLVVHEAAEASSDERSHVVLLHDFTFRDPEQILAELKAGGGAHAQHDMAGMDHSKMDMKQIAAMASAMLNDVDFDAYLANDRTLEDPEVVAVDRGGRVRLRIINGAAASNMWIDLGLLRGELIAVDGHAIAPVSGSVFPLAMAQRADIRLHIPKEAGSWPITFRPEGVAQRTGIILATPGAAIGRLASALEAPSPAIDLALESQLRAVAPRPDMPVTRTQMLMLTGGGPDYMWGFNGKPSMHDTLLHVRPGERIALLMHNMTMMAHPMHLHGHVFRVAAINGKAIEGAMRDTVLVPPMQSVTIVFDADNPGTWAFHCHHLYHMVSGMMGVINYISAA
jgi:FtsP/CotA-like multicopper oxidase with cupredoxin domain